MPVGETVFRPSSRADHLTATVKLTAHGPLLHVDILEKEKPSPAELGASLWLGRGEIARDCPRGVSRGWPRVGASLWIGRVESDASKQGDRFDDLDEILYRYVEPLVENMREVTHASAHTRRRTRVHTRTHAHARTRTHAHARTRAHTHAHTSPTRTGVRTLSAVPAPVCWTKSREGLARPLPPPPSCAWRSVPDLSSKCPGLVLR